MKPTVFLFVILGMVLSIPNLWAQDFVVVRRDTKFFPSATGIKPFSRPNNESGFLTVELLEENEQRVLVRIAPEKKSSCYSSSPIFKGTELRLWVNRSSLEKVTTESLNWTFKDGPEVEIAAGMVVDGRHVLTKISSLELAIPQEKVSFSFQKEYLSLGSTKRTISLISEKGIKYDGDKYFKKGVFTGVVNIGTFAQIKDKCVRVRGRLYAKKVLYGTVDKAEMSMKMYKKWKSKVIDNPIFVEGEIQPDNVEDERELKDQILVQTQEPMDKYAGLNLDAKMKIGKMKIKGTDPKNVKKAFQQKAKRWKSCYTLYKNPNLAGRVSIQVKIATNGAVKSATLIQSSMYDRGIERCLLWRIRKAKFMPMGETTVILPLKFWSVKY